MHILLVEDHQDTLMVQAMLLKKRGYQVETATTMGAARTKAAEFPVDLLVSDIRLPDGSGADLMHELRQQYGLRGIALTGADNEEVERNVYDVGFSRVLLKPVSPERLLETVQELSWSPNSQS